MKKFGEFSTPRVQCGGSIRMVFYTTEPSQHEKFLCAFWRYHLKQSATRTGFFRLAAPQNSQSEHTYKDQGEQDREKEGGEGRMAGFSSCIVGITLRSQRLSSCHSLKDFLPLLLRPPFLPDSELLDDEDDSDDVTVEEAASDSIISPLSRRRSPLGSASTAPSGLPSMVTEEEGSELPNADVVVVSRRSPERKSAASTADGLRGIDVSKTGERNARRRSLAPALEISWGA